MPPVPECVGGRYENVAYMCHAWAVPNCEWLAHQLCHVVHVYGSISGITDTTVQRYATDYWRTHAIRWHAPVGVHVFLIQFSLFFLFFNFFIRGALVLLGGSYKQRFKKCHL